MNMKNLENLENFNHENNNSLNSVDQLAPKEEALNFKEKDEILDSLQILKDRQNMIFSEIEILINSITDGSIDVISGQAKIAENNRNISKLAELIAAENNRLEIVENFLNEVKDSLGSQSVNN